jgi:hypothetical protein
MAYLLKSESGRETGWTSFAWPIVRVLAEDFGWHPRGTLPPPDWNDEVEKVGEWPGGYTSNDGQLVSEPDAQALGAALEATLASEDFEQRIRGLHQVAGEQMESPGCRVTLPVDASGWRKDVEDFIDFCRKGGFRLY